MRRPSSISGAVAVFLLCLASLATAQEDSSGAPETDEASEPEVKPRRVGGPDQVDNTIADDDASISRVVERSLFEPYFAWKKRLKEKTGIGFGIDYSTASLAASDSPADAEDRAGSGMVRFFGSWDLVGRESGNTGAFIWKVEHRHKYTAIPPSALGFNLGYAGLFEPPFSDQGFRFTNLYWKQRGEPRSLPASWTPRTTSTSTFSRARGRVSSTSPSARER